MPIEFNRKPEWEALIPRNAPEGEFQYDLIRYNAMTGRIEIIPAMPESERMDGIDLRFKWKMGISEDQVDSYIEALTEIKKLIKMKNAPSAKEQGLHYP